MVKLTSDIANLFCIQGYKLLTNNTPLHNGGLAIYVNEILRASNRLELHSSGTFLESFYFVEFTYDSKSVLVGIVYRNPKAFLEHLQNILNIIRRERRMSLITGEFNIDLSKTDSCGHVQNLSTLTKHTKATPLSVTFIGHR